MNTNDIYSLLKSFEFDDSPALTIDSINKQYKTIIEREELLIDPSLSKQNRLKSIQSIKKQLIDNIDEIVNFLVAEILSDAKSLFEKELLSEAKKKYYSISKLLSPGMELSNFGGVNRCLQLLQNSK